MKKTFIFYFTTLVPPEAGRWPKERVYLIFIFIGFFCKTCKVYMFYIKSYKNKYFTL